MMAVSPAASVANRAWSWLLWMWGTCIVVAGVVKRRTAWEAPYVLDLIAPSSDATKEALETWANRGAAGVLALAALYALWRGGGALVRGWPLAVLLGILVQIMAMILGGIIGPMPGVTISAAVMFLLVLPCARSGGPDAGALLALIGAIARTILLLSLVLAVVWTEWVAEVQYPDSWVPGATFRLHGVTGHAHALATFAFLLLVARISQPSRWWWIDYPLVVAVVLMSQSKQFLAVMALFLAVAPLVRPMGFLARWSLGLRVACVVPVALAIIVGFVALVPTKARIVPEDQREKAESFTGRTLIWQETLQAWQASPLVGNGPRLWSPEMSQAFAGRHGWAPAHAHNQLLQSLAQGGVLGLAGLLVTMVGLTVLAVRIRDRDLALVALAVMLLVWVRGLVEVYIVPVPQDAAFLALVVFWKCLALRDPGGAGGPAP
jgi:O-antigen ligase